MNSLISSAFLVIAVICAAVIVAGFIAILLPERERGTRTIYAPPLAREPHPSWRTGIDVETDSGWTSSVRMSPEIMAGSREAFEQLEQKRGGVA